MLKICVMGLGYVGLPVALGVSKRFNTVGYDINQKRIKNLTVVLTLTMILKKSFNKKN